MQWCKLLNKSIKSIFIKSFSLSLLLISANIYAVYCNGPAGSGFIDVGDDQATVLHACGKPTQVAQSEKQNTELKSTQYWTYFNTSTSINPYNPQGNIDPGSVTSNGPTIVLEFKSNQVTRITVNGDAKSSTNQCPTNNTISVGDPPQKVQSNCGVPDSLNTVNENANVGPPNKMETWTYDNGPNSPPLVLEFTAGQLTGIENQ